jgi:hypothetical protein
VLSSRFRIVGMLIARTDFAYSDPTTCPFVLSTPHGLSRYAVLQTLFYY